MVISRIGRDHPGLFKGRQQADGDRRQTHQGDGHQKGRLAARPVPEPAEHQRPERPHHEADAKGDQGQDVGVAADLGIEMRAMTWPATRR
jgi:hypothetical protein